MEFSFGLMGFLFVFPLIVAAALLFVRQEGPRRVIVCVSGVAIALASVVLVVMNLGASCTLFAFESMAIDFICTGISVAIAAVIVWFAVRYKNLWAAVLAGVQVVGTLILEFMFSHGIEVPYSLYEQLCRIAEAAGAKLAESDFAENVLLTFRMLDGTQAPFLEKLTELTRGQSEIIVTAPFDAAF